jgi:sialate O-acetylesterase
MSLYNGMVHPIIPFGIKGVIWYQGESNASRGYQYRKLFQSMIEDWRVRWELEYFPFLFVQLANARDIP